MQWEVNVQGKPAGPFSSTRLKQLAGEGRLVPSDFVRPLGDRRWRRAAEVEGLFARVVTPQPAPAIPVATAIVMPPPQHAPPPPPEAPRKPYSPQRIGLVAASFLGAVGTFMPWIHVGALSINGTRGDGWVTFVFFATVVVSAVVGELHKPLGLVATFFALLGGGTAFAVAIEKITTFERATGKARADLAGNPFGLLITEAASIGNGLYLIAMAGAAVVGVALFFRR